MAGGGTMYSPGRRTSSSWSYSKRRSRSRNTGCLGCAGCMIPTVLTVFVVLAGIICLIAAIV